MIRIKQFFRNASVGFHTIFMCLLILCIIGIAGIYTNVSEILFYILFTVFVVLFVFDAYYAIHKTAENFILKREKMCCDEIMKFLSSEYSRIYVFSSSGLDKSLYYYGKIDSDGRIFVYGQDKSGKEVFKDNNVEYTWFMNNFFTM